jgi:hypothetical protein
VVTGTHADAELVKYLSDVVGVYSFDVETDHAAAFNHVERSDDSYASVKGQVEAPEGVFG